MQVYTPDCQMHAAGHFPQCTVHALSFEQLMALIQSLSMMACFSYLRYGGVLKEPDMGVPPFQETSIWFHLSAFMKHH